MRPTFGRPTALCKHSPSAAVSSPFEIILADEENLFPMKRNRISLGEMIRLYEEEGLSLTEVGRMGGVSRQAVHYRLVKAGVRLRPQLVEGPKPPRFEREEMVDLYVNQRLSLNWIAEL